MSSKNHKLKKRINSINVENVPPKKQKKATEPTKNDELIKLNFSSNIENKTPEKQKEAAQLEFNNKEKILSPKKQKKATELLEPAKNDQLLKLNFSSNIENKIPEKRMETDRLESNSKDVPTLDDIKKLVEETMESKVNSLKEFIEKQNSLIVELIAQNAALLKRVVCVEQDISKTVNEFPIQTVEELMELEEKLDNNNLQTYIAAVRKIILPSGITKSFSMLFNKDIILSYNYDGIKGKSAFKDLKKINDILFRAIDNGKFSMNDYIQQIRKGFKLCKNAHFKNVCIANKNKNESQNIA